MYLFLTLYAAGVTISLIWSLHSFLNFQHIRHETNIDFFAKRPSMALYLIAKPLLWPYFLVTEKSPIERFSELFFKHYGDKGHTYYGNRGLKNLLNDMLQGSMIPSFK